MPFEMLQFLSLIVFLFFSDRLCDIFGAGTSVAEAALLSASTVVLNTFSGDVPASTKLLVMFAGRDGVTSTTR
jgi:hypothetical protein